MIYDHGSAGATNAYYLTNASQDATSQTDAMGQTVSAAEQQAQAIQRDLATVTAEMGNQGLATKLLEEARVTTDPNRIAQIDRAANAIETKEVERGTPPTGGMAAALGAVNGLHLEALVGTGLIGKDAQPAETAMPDPITVPQAYAKAQEAQAARNAEFAASLSMNSADA